VWNIINAKVEACVARSVTKFISMSLWFGETPKHQLSFQVMLTNWPLDSNQLSLLQATGLGQRVHLFKEMISSDRANLRATFLMPSSSLPSMLAQNLNLPLNFLHSFDETSFRPKVVLKSTAVPAEDLTIYRFSSPNQGRVAFTLVLRFNQSFRFCPLIMRDDLKSPYA